MGCEIELLVQSSTHHIMWRSCCDGKALDQKGSIPSSYLRNASDIPEASISDSEESPFNLWEKLEYQNAVPRKNHQRSISLAPKKAVANLGHTLTK